VEEIFHKLWNFAFSQQDRTLRRYLNPELLIIDDFGLKQLPKNSGEHLFEVIMRRYENRSTVMTSNRPLEEWGKLLGDVPTAGAILDRFLHHAQTIAITGRSCRLKTTPPMLEKRIKTRRANPNPTNLGPPGPRAKAGSSGPARFTSPPVDYGNVRMELFHSPFV